MSVGLQHADAPSRPATPDRPAPTPAGGSAASPVADHPADRATDQNAGIDPVASIAASLAAGSAAAGPASAHRVRDLQQRVGNHAVSLLLQRREVRTEAEVTGPRDWTTADRTSNSARWQAACLANLQAADSSQYIKVVERRDFYKWFYEYTAARGFQTRWALAAHVVANGAHMIADMDEEHDWADDGLVLTSVELQGIMREGNQVIFDNVLPKLRDLLAGGALKGKPAIEWDMKILAEEQALVQPLYERMSRTTVEQLLYIARKTRFAGLGAWWTGDDKVQKGPFNNPGTVTAFPDGGDITKPEQRWAYGMGLGNKFTPGGSGFDPAHDHMPTPGAGYTDGSELAKVDTRAGLHELDAWLNPNRMTRVRGTPGADIAAIIARLTEAEKALVARDQSPDGWAYSAQLGEFTIEEAVVRRALPAAGGPAVEAFLAKYRAAFKRAQAQWDAMSTPMMGM